MQNLSDDNNTCDTITAVACHFCLVEAEKREELKIFSGKGITWNFTDWCKRYGWTPTNVIDAFQYQWSSLIIDWDWLYHIYTARQNTNNSDVICKFVNAAKTTRSGRSSVNAALMQPVSSSSERTRSTVFDKKLSYRRGTAQRAVSVEILTTSAQQYKKVHLKRHAIAKWPWKPLKVIVIAAIRKAILLLLVCSNVSILHRFRDTITHKVYVTACDLEKSFSFEITSH